MRESDDDDDDYDDGRKPIITNSRGDKNDDFAVEQVDGARCMCLCALYVQYVRCKHIPDAISTTCVLADRRRAHNVDEFSHGLQVCMRSIRALSLSTRSVIGIGVENRFGGKSDVDDKSRACAFLSFDRLKVKVEIPPTQMAQFRNVMFAH